MSKPEPSAKQEILIDNADVKVTRITIPGGVSHSQEEMRNKRVIVFLTDSHHSRETDQSGNSDEVEYGEDLIRKAGDVSFREASNHVITNLGEDEQRAIIIELKR